MTIEKVINTRKQLVEHVSALVEEAYNLGYSDGRDDANARHKQHIMDVLKSDLEKNNAHSDRG